MGNSEFVIDGRSFEPGRVDESVTLGTTEEWTLRNDSMMDHPFHLHVWPFVVVDRSDRAPRPTRAGATRSTCPPVSPSPSGSRSRTSAERPSTTATSSTTKTSA